MKKDLDDRLKILIKKVKKDEFIWFTQAFRDRNPSENEFKLYSLLVEAIQSQRALQKVEKKFYKDYTRGLEEVLRRTGEVPRIASQSGTWKMVIYAF